MLRSLYVISIVRGFFFAAGHMHNKKLFYATEIFGADCLGGCGSRVYCVFNTTFTIIYISRERFCKFTVLPKQQFVSSTK